MNQALERLRSYFDGPTTHLPAYQQALSYEDSDEMNALDKASGSAALESCQRVQMMGGA